MLSNGGQLVPSSVPVGGGRGKDEKDDAPKSLTRTRAIRHLQTNFGSASWSFLEGAWKMGYAETSFSFLDRLVSLWFIRFDSQFILGWCREMIVTGTRYRYATTCNTHLGCAALSNSLEKCTKYLRHLLRVKSQEHPYADIITSRVL